ncbi:olfactory receptor 1G1-like [Xenopus laevis]|uniref:Olfactory receptor n=2 Tax=Xenopus laevis TaxID=8355 RepID=A0A974DGD6_XENLA|nr:olfactory receptor 1G1-like [Xenopus laevis]OCT90207.1 hypothetical protein XELAEV_18018820mg [Xenopus laevis]
MKNEQNYTTGKEFHLIAFSSCGIDTHIMFFVILLIYLLTMLGNLFIIILVYLDYRLHTPMYFFLCNLAVQDIMFVSAILPKLIAITITGDNSISFIACLTQVFMFAICVDTDFFLLAVMAFDRFVAICIPLRYYFIMSPRLCIILVATPWILYVCNGICYCFLFSALSFCKSHDLNYIFCDIKTVLGLSCSNTAHIQTLISVEAVVFGFLPLTFTLTSYVNIIATILKIKSSAVRLKTFSSCSSHLTVVLMFCGTSLSLYVKPNSEDSQELDRLIPFLYVGLVPMLNPIVYSLRNKQVWSATRAVYGKFKKQILKMHFYIHM